MDDPDHPMGNAENSSRIVSTDTNLKGNSSSFLAFRHRFNPYSAVPMTDTVPGDKPSESDSPQALGHEPNLSSIASRHTSLTASGQTVISYNPTSEETPPQGAQVWVRSGSIAARLPSVVELLSAQTPSQTAFNRARRDYLQVLLVARKVERVDKAAAKEGKEKGEREKADREAAQEAQYSTPAPHSDQRRVAPDIANVASLLLPATPLFPQSIEAMKTQRCILMVNNGPVVGTIDNQAGYKVFMKMDGRPSDPILFLSFKCNRFKTMSNQLLSDKAQDVDVITLRFRPQQKSISHPGVHMIEQYQYGMLHSVDRGNTTIWREEVVQLLDDRQIPHVGVFRFFYWDIEATALPKAAFWKHYYKGSSIQEVFEVLFGAPPVGITIWVSLEHLTEASWAGFGVFDEAFRNRPP